jgi:hypothetical protein
MDTNEFDQEVADYIIRMVSEGRSVYELWKADKSLPHPIVVNRWKKERPKFQREMEEAEAVAAEKLVWETLAIADDPERAPGQAKNAISTRQWLADKLSKKFEEKGRGGGIHINFQGRLTNEQLMQIAAGNVIEGEVVPPLLEDKDGDE